MHIRARRRVAATLAGLGALTAVAAAPAAAPAADPTQQLVTGAVLTSQPPGGRWGVELILGARLGTTDGSPGSPIKHMAFKFPKAFVNADAFPTCAAATLRQRGPAGCPSGSRIGRGTALADVRPLLANPIAADIDIFNGPGTDRSRKINLIARARGIEVTIILEGTLKRTSGTYGYQLDLPVPLIKTLNDAPDAAIAQFDVRVGARTTRRGKRVSFLEAPTSCSGSGFPFLGTFSYYSGASGTDSSNISCTLMGS